MPVHDLHPISGEFREASTEVAFRAERLPETLRHARLAFAFSAVLNTMFLASDWRFYGDPHFLVAVPARLMVIAAALVAWALSTRIRDLVRLQALLLAFQAVVAVGVGLLVTARTDLALLVAGLLPVLFYLVVPNVFRAAIVAGVGASIATLTGYLVLGEGPAGVRTTALGLVLGMVLLNAGMLLVVSRSNRMRRLEWAATQRERLSNRELAESRAAFEKMFRTVPIPLVVSQRESGTIVAVNDAGLRFLAVPQLSSDVRTPSFYEDPHARTLLLETLAREASVDGFETRLRRADGEVRDVIAGTWWRGWEATSSRSSPSAPDARRRSRARRRRSRPCAGRSHSETRPSTPAPGSASRSRPSMIGCPASWSRTWTWRSTRPSRAGATASCSTSPRCAPASRAAFSSCETLPMRSRRI